MTFAKQLTIYTSGFVIALVAWALNVTQLYWMAGSLFLLPQLSRLYGLLEHRGLTVTRRLPHAAYQGETVEVRLHARNEWNLPKLHLWLVDRTPRGLEAPPDPLPIHLASGGEEEVSYPLRLGRRGLHALEEVRVQSQDILGLFNLRSEVPAHSEILVYPRVVELPAWAYPPDLGGGRVPLESSRQKGEGASFFGIREYRPGDPLRHVHWRTAARLSRLTVIEWEAEESLDAVLAVETQKGSEIDLGQSTTLDLAAGLGASLASSFLTDGHSLRLLAPGFTEWRPVSERGPEAMADLLESLARMAAVHESSVGLELRRVTPHLPPGTLICWLAPAPTDEMVTTAQYLRAANLRPVVYALAGGAPAAPLNGGAPGGSDPDAWDATGLEAAGIPVIRVQRDAELVQRLLG